MRLLVCACAKPAREHGDATANPPRDPSPSPSVDGRESHREFSVPTPSTSATRRTGRKNSSIPRSSWGGGNTRNEASSPGLKIEKENATSVAMRNKDAMARHKDRMMRKSLNTPN